MMHDTINDAITTIKNYERIGRSECMVRPTSKLLIDILKVFQKEGYIGEFEAIEDGRGGIYRIMLLGKINDCNVIKPRFPVRKGEFVKWERRFLPAEGFGVIVVSTPQGVMTHSQAKEKEIGGRLIAYFY